MAFKMRTGTYSEFGNGANMSEGEIVNVKSGLPTENGGAMFYAPRDGVPERVVTDVDQTIESDLNFTGTISKNGTALTPSAAEINRLSGVTDNVQSQINDLGDDITALNQSFAQFSNVLSGASACGLTAQTGVTITRCYKLKIGRLVSYNVQISLTASASATSLIRGFEIPAGYINGMTGSIRAFNNSSGAEFYLYISADNGGELRTSATPSSADLRFNLTYIAHS